MKKILAFATASMFLQALPAAYAAEAPAAVEKEQHRGHHGEARQYAEIEQVLARYAQALNAGDVAGVDELYANDGVLMAPEAPSVVGSDAIRDAYTGTFQAIGLDIAFSVAEIKLLSPEWAFLRTNSTGTITIVANGARVPEGNQELFLLRRQHGQWKIARYSFSSFLKPA